MEVDPTYTMDGGGHMVVLHVHPVLAHASAVSNGDIKVEDVKRVVKILLSPPGAVHR